MQDLNKLVMLELEAQDVLAIIQVLGKLPTEIGAFPVYDKIKRQLDLQTSQGNSDGK